MIEKKRVRNVSNSLIGVKDNDEFFVGKKVEDVPISVIKSLGFSSEIVNGEQLLPGILGPISRFNARGSFVKLKHLPKETCYRSASIKDWHGRYHFVDIPYKRYQRQILHPASIEIKIVNNNGTFYFLSPLLERNALNEPIIKHVINLFLELFGSCEILTKALAPTISSIPTKRVNWKILPAGEYPWKRIAFEAGDLASTRSGKSRVQEHTVNVICKYKPTELIYGVGGFRGYLIFRFLDKNIFVMENVMYGNATYIFENEWERFSQLTKAEVINNHLSKGRLEHRSGWEQKIDGLLG